MATSLNTLDITTEESMSKSTFSVEPKLLYQQQVYVFDVNEELILVIGAEDYYNDNYIKQINGNWSFEFNTNISLSKYFTRKNKIGIYDREGNFQLFSIEDIVDTYSLEPSVNIYCIHDSIEQLNSLVLEELDISGSVSSILDALLVNTTYIRGNVDNFDNTEISLELSSRLSGLRQLSTLVNGEINFRYTLDDKRQHIVNRYVDITHNIGRDTGIRFTFDTNIKEVKKTITSNNHFTVIYARGRSLATGETNEDGSRVYKRITFADEVWSVANGDPADKPLGQTYIEDPEAIAKYGRIEGVYTLENVTDSKTLIKRAYNKLENSKDPQATYEVSIEDLSRLTGYEHLSVALGDTVIIQDEDFDLCVSARIQEEQYSIRDNIPVVIKDEQMYNINKASARAIGGVSSSSKKLVLGVLQPTFTEEGSDGIITTPTVDIPSTPDVDDSSFPNVLPLTPVLSGKGLFASVMLSWTFNNASYFGYELHGSQSRDFTPTDGTILSRGKMSSFLHNVKPSEVWYYRVRAYNTHEHYTPYSEQIEVQTAKIADGAEWFESAAIGDALIQELRLDRGWVGQLYGNKIDARELSVTNGNGDKTLDIDSFGNVALDVATLKIRSQGIEDAMKGISLEVSNKSISDLQIGGVNLLIDSKLPLLLVSDDSNNDCAIVENDTVKLTAKSEGNVYGNLTNSESFEQNVEYTLSFEILTQHSLGMYWYPSEQYIKADYIQGSDSWQKVSFTYTQTGETRKGNALFGFYQLRANEVYYYKNLKLEKGNKSTDYSPSFADIESSIAKIDVKSDEINLSVNKLKRGGRVARWVRCYMWGNNVNNGNHTVEVEVWSNGVNVARGKSAYSNHNAVHQNSALTDGNKDTGWYTYLDDHYDGMDFYWEIDLGQEYSIDDIWLWNYYGDERKYNFSLNLIDENLNSVNVYNTNVGGTYTETPQGKNFVLNASLQNNQMAKIDIKADRIQSTVESVQTDLRDNYPTTTTMNSAINQKANEITSTVEETKRVGVELLPQGYLHNSSSGYHPVVSTFYWNQWGLYVNTRAWVRSVNIAVDRNLPLSYYFYVQNTDGVSTQMHIGFEQLDWRGNEIGENASTLYVANDIFTGYRVFEGVLDAGNFHTDTKFIRLRWLSNWNSGSIAYQYMHEMSIKQLRAVSSSTQIAQMSDKIESKVDVNGVKSTITQSAHEVNMAFNEYSRWDGSSGTEARILFNQWGIHSAAPDGSYSKIGGGKVEHYIAGANYKYHSLIHVETIRLNNEWGIIGGYFGVPYRYQGLNFNVIASISYVGFDRDVAHAFKNLNVSVTEINPSNCTYRLDVVPIGVDVLGAYTVNASKVEVVVTIIA